MSATQEYEHWNLDYGYELFIAFISVLSIFNMVLLYIPGIDFNAAVVVGIINLVLTLIFLFDFVLRLVTTPSRTRYFFSDFGWADLLACVPFFRIFRIFRILKAYRLFHRYGIDAIKSYLFIHRAESALFILISAGILIIELGSFLILLAENGAENANIVTAPDALWWVYVTITTVGYGDHYPVTNMGRFIGILVMTMGVGVFATFAGFISNKLLTPSEKTPKKDISLLKNTKNSSEPFEQLKQLLKERERIDTAIDTLINTIEVQLAHTVVQEQEHENITTKVK